MKLIGNTEQLIDWADIVAKLKNGNTLCYTPESFPGGATFNELDRIWQEAGYKYNDPSVEWTNYFPGAGFDSTVVDTFQTIVGAKPWMVWISQIRPGKMAPWHFDAHSKLDELLALGTPVRYTCYIQEPHNGHISIVDDTSVYLPACGSIYEWPSYNAWHCGVNGGLTDKYMFNYWGYN